MRRILYPIAFVFLGVLAVMAAENSPRSMQILDILAWRHIQSQAVSTDGQWLAYRLVPNDGDSEVVVRNLSNATEQRFPAGATAGEGPTFSDDARWVAFLVSPTVKEGKALKKQRKPVETKA